MAFADPMRALACLILAATAACSGGASDDDVVVASSSSALTAPELVTPKLASAEQRTAFAMLSQKTQRPWTWVQHVDRQTPKHLSAPRIGRPVLGANADVAQTTLAILEENKTLFRLRSPALELRPVRTRTDSLGMRHARFEQTVHGVPVSGAELAVHYDRDGRLTSIDSNYVPDLDVDVNPALALAEARASAVANVGLRTGARASDLEPKDGSLVVYAPQGAAAKLAYEVTVSAMATDTPSIWVVTVDAKTGDVLHAYDKLQTIAGRGVGVLGDEKTIEVAQSQTTSNLYEMTDSSKGIDVKTFSAGGERNRGQVVTSTNIRSWDENVLGAGSAVDAHAHAAIVLSYYQEIHARQGIDGKGGALVSTVHYGKNYDNAAWDGSGMLYGDGGEMFYPPSVNLDVVGHEFTHGVTERTSALEYESQTGALNEAVSDIFGAFIEHFSKPDDQKNWTIGETALRSGGALRDMKEPGAAAASQPAHMNEYLNTEQDKGGVHANSGIINNAAYLMTMGGVNPVSGLGVETGIGWEKSEQLWYRANTEYFIKTTDFGQAATALLQAARDLEFSDDELQAVADAFVATGVVDDAEDLKTAAGDGVTKRRTRRRLVITQSSTCSASPSGGATSGAWLLAVAAAVAYAQRRKIRAGVPRW